MTFITGLTDAQNRATPIAVTTSGTTTVSGTVTVGNASIAVTGAFYQATQPVSLASTTITGSVAVTGPLTDTQLRASPVPFLNNDLPGSGSLTARDAVVVPPAGAGATVTGTPTAGSAYALACANGYGSANVTVLGTWTGTLYFEASENSTNGTDGDWINLNFRQTGIVNTVLGGNTTANGLFRGNVSAYTYFRVRSAGAGHTGTASVVVRYSSAVGAIFLNASIPAGTNVIGAANAVVGINATTGDTGAKTATGVGATQTNANNKGAQILLVMGAVSGTTPTFVLKVQGSVDGGTTWYDLPGATTASLTATGNYGITVYSGVAVTAGTTTTGTTAQSSSVLPRTWRVAWTIAGATPSFTITSVQYNYLAT